MVEFTDFCKLLLTRAGNRSPAGGKRTLIERALMSAFDRVKPTPEPHFVGRKSLL
jgi:hypothetical protein